MQVDVIKKNHTAHTIGEISAEQRLPTRKREVIDMNCQGFFKGMAAGMVLGACAAVMADPVSDRQHRRIQKKAEGMFRNIGSIIDSAMDMIR